MKMIKNSLTTLKQFVFLYFKRGIKYTTVYTSLKSFYITIISKKNIFPISLRGFISKYIFKYGKYIKYSFMHSTIQKNCINIFTDSTQ